MENVEQNNRNVESKHEKFKRIAEARANRAAENIRLLGNCSRSNTYEYSDEEVKKIFSFLEQELKDARKRFEKTKRSSKKFTL